MDIDIIHEQLNQVMNVKPNLDRIVMSYCRVSVINKKMIWNDK